ncbi:MAG: hypothetical protein JWO36_6976 [Myxococcales bacterium]|nr:hypothetical protein [Myxococcales bacterium]
MLGRMGHRTSGVLLRASLLAALLAMGASDAYSGAGAHTSITVWAAAPPTVASFGGLTYGGSTPPSGAMITERREVDVDGGEIRITGVASTADPASVQLRSLTDPAVTISEQRFVPGATTPDEILARHIDDPISVVTSKGEVSGVLRSVDAQAIVVEVGTGDSRRLQVMRRDGYVQDIKLPGTSVDKPSLVWRVATKKPGKQTVEVTYRADGMSWTADYLAILNDSSSSIDFSAWATVKNATGAGFDHAELTLVGGGGAAPPVAPNLYGSTSARQSTAPMRFVVPSPVRIGNGESVQVELLPPRTNAKARSVVTFEAMPDPSINFQAYPATECNQLNAGGGSTARAEVAVELDVPSSGPLPDGRVRLFRRKNDRVEVVSEDQLRSTAGIARIHLAPDNDVTGERHAVSCNADERTRTIHEKIEVKVENKSKQPIEVVVREFLWRWPMWRIDGADESVRGVRGGAQTQEYRLALPAGGKKSVTYTVVYTW